MGKHVTHLITGLGKGGAETMLYQTLKYRSRNDISYQVVSLGASHYYEEFIRELGVDVTVLKLKKRPISSLIRMFGLVRKTETLCCWMYHANLLGYFIGKMTGVKRIVWCIRHSNLDPRFNKRTTLKINRICAKLSVSVDAIAYNGGQARNVHEDIGYCKEKGLILENGCDCEEFAPREDAGRLLREELMTSDGMKIVLSVTKDHPIKDIPNFIRAFSMLREERADVVAVMCGTGVEANNERISAFCREHNLTVGKDVFLLGMRHDVPYLMAACDLFVLHSAGEAFPNVLLQAMACGCLCVTTDAGDAATILEDSSGVVPSGNAVLLNKKMEEKLELNREEKARIKRRNRERILNYYSIQHIVMDYEKLM